MLFSLPAGLWLLAMRLSSQKAVEQVALSIAYIFPPSNYHLL